MDAMNLDISQAARLLARREISSVELTRQCLSKIRKVQRRLNICVGIDDESALSQAEAADRRTAAGITGRPLHGIPLAHKDIFYRRGQVSSAGSPVFSDHKATYTARVKERLDEAGAIDVGRLQSAECALSPTGFSAKGEPVRNPWNTAYLPGGSSSGSGAAVAARAVFGSLGSDTGGSVRHPAAMSGVLGLKPTYGRVSRYGMMPLAPSLDCPGILSRTARDCAKLLRVVAGRDEQDPTSRESAVPDYESFLDGDLDGIRVGIPDRYYYDDIDPGIAGLVRESVDVLTARGATVCSVSPGNIARLNELMQVVLSVESYAVHSRWLHSRPEDFGDQVRARIESGRCVQASVYDEALGTRDRSIREFLDESFENADVLHIPCVPARTPLIEDELALSVNDALERNATLTRCTRAINYLGLPAVSVPCGFAENELPAAFQLVGQPMAEGLLLKIADAYQRDTAWHETIPSLPGDSRDD